MGDFVPIDRHSADIGVKSRLIQNGKIKGDPGNNRLVKLPGLDTTVSSREIDGGGYIDLDQVFAFKDPNHEFAVEETFFAISGNGLYWWNGTKWMEVEWNGTGSPYFDEPRIWKERGRVHILGGIDGISAVYRMIDRDPGLGNGYFNNAFGYNGFWFGEEEYPTLNINESSHSYIGGLYAEAVKQDDSAFTKFLTLSRQHRVLAIYIFDDGGMSKPVPLGSKSLISTTVTDLSATHIIIGSLILEEEIDRRVVAIDLFACVDKEEMNMDVDWEQTKGKIDRPNYDLEFARLPWKFFKRIDVNYDTIWYAGSMTAGSTTTLTYAAADGAAGCFPKATLTLWDMWLKYKQSETDDWNYVEINSFTNDGTDETITVASAVLTNTETYTCQIVTRWADNGDNRYKTYWMWRYDGIADSDVTELGDPIDTLIPWKLYGEHYPNPRFAQLQDRQVWYLDCLTDKRYRNMLLPSEIDIPAMTPNGAGILLNTDPGEEAMGLEKTPRGLLALFERSVHFIRIAGIASYDEDDDKYDESCISTRSIITVNGITYWCGINGIRAFDGNSVRTISDRIEDDYLGALASEYSANNNSYVAINARYSQKEKLVLFAFPNSSYTVESSNLTMFAYDPKYDGFYYLRYNKDFIHMFEGYNKVLYGVDEDGIYEVFAASPSLTSQFMYKTGVYQSKSGMLFMNKFHLSYLGTPTFSAYVNRSGTAISLGALTEQTTLWRAMNHLRLIGNQLQFRIQSPISTADMEILDFVPEIKELDSRGD